MKPILFNADMVRAILEGRKTVTRRVVKPQPQDRAIVDCDSFCNAFWYDSRAVMHWVAPPYQPGDVLWVRETWCWCPCWDCGMLSEDETTCQEDSVERVYSEAKDEWGCYCYKASCREDEQPSVDVWHPSIHMPRKAARIFLRVKAVRVERLRDITEEQAKAEGAQRARFSEPSDCGAYSIIYDDKGTYKSGSVQLWESTIKPADRALYGWEANPWVWVIEFERIGREEARHDD